MSRPRLALMALAGVVVLGGSIALGTTVVSSPSTGPSDQETTTGAAASPDRSSPATPPFKTFTDQTAGFSIGYPRGWKRLTSPDAGVRLIAADGKKMSLLVRIAPVGLNVTQDTLSIARSLTDRLVTSDRSVKLLAQPQQISVGGLPGYRYLYTFGARGKTRGAHVHYFLFRNMRLIGIVLQVPSVRALQQDLVLLDRVAGSFRRAE